jgi:hypothetical protein
MKKLLTLLTGFLLFVVASLASTADTVNVEITNQSAFKIGIGWTISILICLAVFVGIMRFFYHRDNK